MIDDCLLKVFGYLNMTDLVQVSKVDNSFKELITEFVVKNHVFHLVCHHLEKIHPSTVEKLETFGKSIRKVKIVGSKDAGFLLETLLKYFEPATLTEVDMNIDHIHRHNLYLDVVHRSKPIFSKVRKLRIIFNVNRPPWSRHEIEWIHDFLMAMNLCELEVLKLKNSRMDHEFLKSESYASLRLLDTFALGM